MWLLCSWPLLKKTLSERINFHLFIEDPGRRFVDETLTIMPNIAAASNFFDTLNNAQTFVKSPMETAGIQWRAPISGYPVAEPIASNIASSRRSVSLGAAQKTGREKN